MKGKEDKPAVVVANIVDDPRFVEVPKLTIVALKISDTAKERVEKVGGRFMTFD
jgi:large subunit ribosomal protein L18e